MNRTWTFIRLAPILQCSDFAWRFMICHPRMSPYITHACSTACMAIQFPGLCWTIVTETIEIKVTGWWTRGHEKKCRDYSSLLCNIWFLCRRVSVYLGVHYVLKPLPPTPNNHNFLRRAINNVNPFYIHTSNKDNTFIIIIIVDWRVQTRREKGMDCSKPLHIT